VALDADLPSSTRTGWFARRFPERFFNFGVAEQNLFGAAAGLATCGKIPFASTFAVFATERAFNQIRQCIAYPRIGVKIVVSHSGFSASGDGGSHQALIDIGLMRSLPNMTVIAPADASQTLWAVEAAATYEGPVYIRLGKTKVPVFFPPGTSFQIGQAVCLREGSAVTVLVTGSLLSQVMEAADRLQADGIEPEVIHLHTIKPLDRETIVRSARKTGSVVTVEEHSIIGGLGSAVCELLAEHHPVPVRRIGIQDVFGESGSLEELYEKHGLTAAQIACQVKKAAGR
jgi:transketolase